MWKTLIHFTTKSVVKFWFLWLVFCFIWYLFFQSLNVVYMILTALIISVSMEWIIIAFENKVKQRWVAIAITYFLLVLFLLSWIIFIVPFIISQIAHLIEWISWITVSLKDFVMNNSWPEAIREVGWLPVFADRTLEWIEFGWIMISNSNTLKFKYFIGFFCCLFKTSLNLSFFIRLMIVFNSLRIGYYFYAFYILFYRKGLFDIFIV